MNLLGIRTDAPNAELYLYRDAARVAKYEWDAGRSLARVLLSTIEEFLSDHKLSLQDIDGLFVFEGPGSFTGLRIGMSVANSAAYSLQIPIVAERGETWAASAVRRLLAGEDDKVALPFYGAEARITHPKK